MVMSVIDLTQVRDVPGERECLACFVARRLTETPCDGTLRWATVFRDARSPTATGLEHRLADNDATCDCRIVGLGWTLERHLLVRDLHTDELEQPRELPGCASVRSTSTHPCANWRRIRARPRRGEGPEAPPPW